MTTQMQIFIGFILSNIRMSHSIRVHRLNFKVHRYGCFGIKLRNKYK